MVEPKSFKHVVEDPNWMQDMAKEIQALEKNKTWELILLPLDEETIGFEWVYKIKHKPNGNIKRYKARVAAKGYNQQEGLDYHNNFALDEKLIQVRYFLALAKIKNWHLYQLGINNIFLYGDLDEEISMKLLLCFSKNGNRNLVCHLKKITLRA